MVLYITSVLLRITPDHPEPIYAQLVRQIRRAIVAHEVLPGEKIPSHRELAQQLVINHLTVKRAFDELEAVGLLTTRRGMGTYVADPLPAELAAEARAEVVAELSRSAAAALAAGLSRAAWLDLARSVWKERP